MSMWAEQRILELINRIEALERRVTELEHEKAAPKPEPRRANAR